MRQFNVAVLGIGDISDVYIRNLKTYNIVNVVACAGRDTKKARRKAEAHNLPKSYASAENSGVFVLKCERFERSVRARR
jgi:predicted dehydrogenase